MPHFFTVSRSRVAKTRPSTSGLSDIPAGPCSAGGLGDSSSSSGAGVAAAGAAAVVVTGIAPAVTAPAGWTEADALRLAAHCDNGFQQGCDTAARRAAEAGAIPEGARP